MEPKKRADDFSQLPTRKIDSMSELAAESVLDRADAVEDSGPQADAAALEISRLIEVRSVPPPPITASAPGPASKWTKGRLALALIAGAVVLVALSVAVTLFVVK
jgi:hypothetical protein